MPDAVAKRLHTYLEAFTSPRHRKGHRGLADGDRIPVETKRGQAFCALMEAIDPERLPAHGGDATTLIVTVSIDQLRKDLGTAELGPADKLTLEKYAGSPASPRSSRPCSTVSPRCLTWAAPRGCSEPAQRKAMIIRDRECRAEGCSIPAAWCEAHHWGRPWARGGRTDLKDGVLLCSWHHHRAHDNTFDSSRMPNGDVRFRRRT